MKLDTDLLRRLVALRLHLVGTGAAPVSLDDDQIFEVRLANGDKPPYLVFDEATQDVALNVTNDDGSKRPLGVANLTHANQFATMLHNVDTEMAHAGAPVTADLVDLADALALSRDPAISALVDDIVARDRIEAPLGGATVAPVLTEIFDLADRSIVPEISELVTRVLERQPGTAPELDFGANIEGRAQTIQTAQGLPDRTPQAASPQP